jgi:Flp pilus assembly protein TadB
MSDRTAASLHALVGLLRSGLTLRLALLRWPDELGGIADPEPRELARRIRLGVPIPDALRGLTVDPLLRMPCDLHLSSGIDIAGWLEREARAIEESTALARSAQAASSGAALSGRMVAGLPLLFLPFGTAAGAPLTDGPGVALIVGGLMLCLAGLRWIARLVPSPPSEDEIARLCVSLSALLRSGLSLDVSLDTLVRTGGVFEEELRRARRSVGLGLTWPQALHALDPEMQTVAILIERSLQLGLPLADELERLASSRRRERAREFEARLRKAPVLMVIPLTLCVLPAFALLALGPFMRSVGL